MNATKGSPIGRGLSSLLDEASLTDIHLEGRLTSGITEVPLDLISPRQQPRTIFDPQAMEELVESVRRHGVLQPVLITRRTDQPDHYHLIAGERRWRASQLVGLSSVPVRLIEIAPQEIQALSLIENLLRDDLTPSEIATALQTLMSKHHWTQADLAQRLGKSRSYVSRMLRVWELDQDVRQYLDGGQLSMAHLRVLGGVDDARQRSDLARIIVEQSLTMKQAQDLVDRRLLGEQSLQEGAGQSHKVAPSLKNRPGRTQRLKQTAQEEAAKRVGAYLCEQYNDGWVRVRVGVPDRRNRQSVQISGLSSVMVDRLLSRLGGAS